MPITINVSINESQDQLTRKILESIQLDLNVAFKQAAYAILKRVQAVCVDMIQNTEEYHSLLSGDLLGELGIPNVNSRLHELLNIIKDEVEVVAIPVTINGQKLSGGVKIEMIESSFMSLLDSPAAEYVSNGKYLIPWLDWLIIQGDRIVVLDYAVTLSLNSSQKARSRTGLGLMIPGAGFRVSPEFSGVRDNNFITRAFKGGEVRDLVGKIIQEELQKRVG